MVELQEAQIISKVAFIGCLDEWSLYSTLNIGTMPWAVSLSLSDNKLSDNKLFIGSKHILFGLFYLILLFVCQILSYELWNRKLKKRNLFLKKIPKLLNKKSQYIYL